MSRLRFCDIPDVISSATTEETNISVGFDNALRPAAFGAVEPGAGGWFAMTEAAIASAASRASRM